VAGLDFIFFASVTYQSINQYSFIKRLAKTQANNLQNAQLSQRDRAAGCVIVLVESGRLELGDNILRTL